LRLHAANPSLWSTTNLTDVFGCPQRLQSICDSACVFEDYRIGKFINYTTTSGKNLTCPYPTSTPINITKTCPSQVKRMVPTPVIVPTPVYVPVPIPAPVSNKRNLNDWFERPTIIVPVPAPIFVPTPPIPSPVPIPVPVPSSSLPKRPSSPSSFANESQSVPSLNVSIVPKKSALRQKIIWGIRGANFNRGIINFDDNFHFDERTQMNILIFCETIRNISKSYEGKINQSSKLTWMNPLVKRLKIRPSSSFEMDCPVENLRNYVTARLAEPFPIDLGRVPNVTAQYFQMRRNPLINLGLYKDSDISTANSSLSTTDLTVKWIAVDLPLNLNDWSVSRLELQDCYDAWEEFLSTQMWINARSADKLRTENSAQQSSITWVRMFTTESAVTNLVVTFGVSILSALVSVLLFTRSLSLSTSCIFTVVNVLLSAAWFLFVVVRWDLGILEAISITIFAGCAVDYTLHIAHVYQHYEQPDIIFGVEMRSPVETRLRTSLEEILSSVTSAACSTLLSAFPLLMCELVIIQNMGLVLSIIIVISILYAIFMLCPLLLVFVGSSKELLPQRPPPPPSALIPEVQHPEEEDNQEEIQASLPSPHRVPQAELVGNHEVQELTTITEVELTAVPNFRITPNPFYRGAHSEETDGEEGESEEEVDEEGEKEDQPPNLHLQLRRTSTALSVQNHRRRRSSLHV